MRKVSLGATGLMVTKTSFGALPIQRVSFDEAARLLRCAYDAGINFFDTANFYTDSEEKIGYALSDVRDKIIIATKSSMGSIAEIRANLELSLSHMKTDYIDIFQLHNPKTLPSDEIYEYLLSEKRAGRIRHIGFTNHRIDLAREAVLSGRFETLQF
ncbi:MAG: aldo/keto reductase, partial [Clostridia bacterium]